MQTSNISHTVTLRKLLLAQYYTGVCTVREKTPDGMYTERGMAFFDRKHGKRSDLCCFMVGVIKDYFPCRKANSIFLLLPPLFLSSKLTSNKVSNITFSVNTNLLQYGR